MTRLRISAAIARLSALADTPFATSFSWWKEAAKRCFQLAGFSRASRSRFQPYHRGSSEMRDFALMLSEDMTGSPAEAG
jgi:hypothetical protein